MDWREMKSTLEKRADEIKKWDVEKRKHPVWDDIWGIWQLEDAVEKQMKEKVNVEKGVAFCPGIGCRSSLDFTHLTPPKYCPWCGQALDWNDVLVCLPEVECDNPDDVAKIFFHKDGKYNEDIRVKVGEEMAIVPRGEWIEVKRKIKEALNNFFCTKTYVNARTSLEEKETSAEVSDTIESNKA